MKSTDNTKEKITTALERDLDCTFEKLLAFRRIKRSQGLMRNSDLSIEKIAELCGFGNIDNYKTQYKQLMNVDPEVSRTALLEKLREEQLAREEEEEED